MKTIFFVLSVLLFNGLIFSAKLDSSDWRELELFLSPNGKFIQ